MLSRRSRGEEQDKLEERVQEWTIGIQLSAVSAAVAMSKAEKEGFSYSKISANQWNCKVISWFWLVCFIDSLFKSPTIPGYTCRVSFNPTDEDKYKQTNTSRWCTTSKTMLHSYMVGFLVLCWCLCRHFLRRMSSAVRAAGEVVSFLSSIWFSVWGSGSNSSSNQRQLRIKLLVNAISFLNS